VADLGAWVRVLEETTRVHFLYDTPTGKTLKVASSSGNKPTDVKINGLPVIVGVNAYIKPGS
jgi:hypothetical protein